MAKQYATALDKYRDYLAIDRVSLDDCLTQQPELFYHVSDAYARAVAARDAAKLDIEEAEAELDLQLRSKAAETDQRVTETQIQQQLRTMPRIQELRREHLQLRTAAESWLALKEAFQQRSFMLRELVAVYIAGRHDASMEAGSYQARTSLADQNRVAAGQLRSQRRQQQG